MVCESGVFSLRYRLLRPIHKLAAPLRSTLESLKRVRNSVVQLIRAPTLQHPAPPSRRERKLSAETHAAGGCVERSTRDVIVNCNAERQSRRQVNHATRLVYVLDGDIHIPLSAERSGVCLNTLSWSRGTPRRNGTRLSIPPSGIICGLGQQIPNALRRRIHSRDGTSAKCHCRILFE